MIASDEPLVARLAGKRLLIFDFDGTVADTSPLHASAFALVLAPFGVTVDYPAIAGRRTREAMVMALASADVQLNDSEVDILVARKQQTVRDMLSEKLQPLPGVDSFLRWARRRYPLAMATSGSRGSVQLALDALGYAGWFNPLVCAEDSPRGKPYPDGFVLVLSATGTQARDALVFEDSQAGFDAATSAGIECVDARGNLWHMLEGTRV
jgi:sugar-phosphatase